MSLYLHINVSHTHLLTMAFNISPNATYKQQVSKYRTATESLTQRVTFEGTYIQYLPSEAVHILKAYDFSPLS